MTLTRADFLADIEKYNERIAKIRERLLRIPGNNRTSKKLEGKLLRDLEHVQHLRAMAYEALEREGGQQILE